MIDLILEDSIILLQFAERLQAIFAGLPSNRFIFDTGAIASFLCCLLAQDLTRSMVLVLIKPAYCHSILLFFRLIGLHLRFQRKIRDILLYTVKPLGEKGENQFCGGMETGLGVLGRRRLGHPSISFIIEYTNQVNSNDNQYGKVRLPKAAISSSRFTRSILYQIGLLLYRAWVRFAGWPNELQRQQILPSCKDLDWRAKRAASICCSLLLQILLKQSVSSTRYYAVLWQSFIKVWIYRSIIQVFETLPSQITDQTITVTDADTHFRSAFSTLDLILCSRMAFGCNCY